jgi:hypothetical protein
MRAMDITACVCELSTSNFPGLVFTHSTMNVMSLKATTNLCFLISFLSVWQLCESLRGK